MSDWRLNGQEAYLSNAILYKITFPNFWEAAYRDKNAFYQRIVRYAEQFVAETNRGHEYLVGDKVQHFWHEHCDFCWDKALTDQPCDFFCTRDMTHWICSDCFHDFREMFNWQVESTEELLD